MNKPLKFGLGLLATLALVACGGGSSGDDPPPARATLVGGQDVTTLTRAQIDGGVAANGLSALVGAAQCDVKVSIVQYITRAPNDELATAATAIMAPSGTSAACSGEKPVVLYAHGTSTDIGKNMANPTDGEAFLTAAFYAAQGMIVVAPNYLGYTGSSFQTGRSWHPYLIAEAQAVDMVDALRAAKTSLANASTKPSNRLFITGYSQGGHVAMATHKVIERDYASEFTVTASGPMSGPYNLVKFGDVVTAGTINAGATIFVPMLITAFQYTYRNIYTTPTEVYQAPYAATAENLLPSAKSVTQLIGEGKLPADPTFTRLFGTGGLLTDSFRAGYQTSNYRRALQTNTLLDWTPRRPMALCFGAQDPTVFGFNSTDAQAFFATRGVAVPAFDLESRASLPAGATGDVLFGGFQAAKAAAGANALAQYHGTLVPPFCNALVRAYFQQVLASGQ